MGFTAFTTSFLFNWIGFLLTMCFCRTIAAWYGALAGFGLSLAKWTLIVKHSTGFASGTDNTWLWWLFTTFGLIVCMRAIFQYLHIKRSWSTLSISAEKGSSFIRDTYNIIISIKNKEALEPFLPYYQHFSIF